MEGRDLSLETPLRKKFPVTYRYVAFFSAERKAEHGRLKSAAVELDRFSLCAGVPARDARPSTMYRATERVTNVTKHPKSTSSQD